MEAYDSVMVQFGVSTFEETMNLGREAADYISGTFTKVKLSVLSSLFGYHLCPNCHLPLSSLIIMLKIIDSRISVQICTEEILLNNLNYKKLISYVQNHFWLKKMVFLYGMQMHSLFKCPIS
ncbi:unnamed protein product [Camellia sinensis]